MSIIPVVQVTKTGPGFIRMRVVPMVGTTPDEVLAKWERAVVHNTNVIGAMIPTPPAIEAIGARLEKMVESAAKVVDVDPMTYVLGHVRMVNSMTDKGDPIWQFVRNVNYER